MINIFTNRMLTIACFAAAISVPAHAGFTIAVKPMEKVAAPVAVPVAEPVHTSPVAQSVVVPTSVKLTVAKGESLQVATKAFLGLFGWTPAWLAGELVAGDAMSFEGPDHEAALLAFLRHYNLVGERFVAEKGYVIRRNDKPTGAN